MGKWLVATANAEAAKLREQLAEAHHVCALLEQRIPVRRKLVPWSTSTMKIQSSKV